MRAAQRKKARRFLSGPFHLRILVRLAGIEPTTPWFVAKYSIQLSYSRLSNIITRLFQFGKYDFFNRRFNFFSYH